MGALFLAWQMQFDNAAINTFIVASEHHRALSRIKLLPVTHVLVDTWMLTVKLVYELSDVPDDLKWATNTHMTQFTLTLSYN